MKPDLINTLYRYTFEVHAKQAENGKFRQDEQDFQDEKPD